VELKALNDIDEEKYKNGKIYGLKLKDDD